MVELGQRLREPALLIDQVMGDLVMGLGPIRLTFDRLVVAFFASSNRRSLIEEIAAIEMSAGITRAQARALSNAASPSRTGPDDGEAYCRNC